MARWKVIDGPARRNARVDGVVMGCVIENVNDPAQRRFIGVTFTRTVLQSDRAALPDAVREAIETDGLSVIEPHLEQAEPAETFLVTNSSIGVHPDG